jgi:hypothetical protein
MRFFLALLVCSGLLAAQAQNLRGSSQEINIFNVDAPADDVDVEEDGMERSLMRSTDRERGCFGETNKANYFARNPFNSDKKEQRALGRRGDWAKCLPTPSYAVMCTHAVHHGFNPNPLEDQDSEEKYSEENRGQKHDWHAGALYEMLLEMHEDKCAHVDLELSPQAKVALDNYMWGTGHYSVPLHSEPEPEPEPEPQPEAEPEPEPEPEPTGNSSDDGSEPEPESESEPEPEAEPEPEPEPKPWMPDGPGIQHNWSSLAFKRAFEDFRNCSGNISLIKDNRTRLRKSLFCALASALDIDLSVDAGQTACEAIYTKNGDLPKSHHRFF